MENLQRIVERSLLASGIILCALFATSRIYGSLASAADLERFDQARTALTANPANASAHSPEAANVDTSLWSDGRIEAYRASLEQASLEQDAALPLAVLEVPAIGLEVPVLEGTTDFILNRAVGHIEGTARPGQSGNVAIAGHRDGFFRGLKDLELGDRIVITTLEDRQEFVIRDLGVVDPSDVHVLEPTPSPTVTLVTCYPFYFIGKAPRRFIVTAVQSPVAVEGDVANGARAAPHPTVLPRSND